MYSLFLLPKRFDNWREHPHGQCTLRNKSSKSSHNDTHQKNSHNTVYISMQPSTNEKHGERIQKERMEIQYEFAIIFRKVEEHVSDSN